MVAGSRAGHTCTGQPGMKLMTQIYFRPYAGNETGGMISKRIDFDTFEEFLLLGNIILDPAP